MVFQLRHITGPEEDIVGHTWGRNGELDQMTCNFGSNLI